MEEKMIQKLREYFKNETNALFAFLYGSAAKGRVTEESDVDIAVYLSDPSQENRLWRDISNLLKTEVDLVELHGAPATLISNVLKTGIPLTMKNRNAFLRLYLESSLEAEDFAEFAHDYQTIYERS